MKSIQWLSSSTHHCRGIIPALQSGPGPFKITFKGHIHEGLAPKNPQSCSSDLSERAGCISFRAKWKRDRGAGSLQHLVHVCMVR